MKRIFAAKKAFFAFACVLALSGVSVFAQITVNDGETKSTADGTGAITVNPGGTFQVSGGQTINPAAYPTFTLVGAANVNPTPALQPILRSTAGDNIINTNIAITNRFTQIHTDSGTLTLNGSIGAGNTAAQVNFNGGGHTITTGEMTTGWININNTTWTVDGGTLNIYGTTAIGGSGDYRWNLNNATINVPSGIRNVPARATLSDTLTLATAAGSTLNMQGILSGTGGITKTGAGTVILSANNTYSGPTAVQTGTLRITGNSVLGGDITITSGLLQIAGNLSGAGTIIHNGVLGGARTDIYRIELENAVVNNDFVINSAAYTGYAGAIYVGSGESTINGDIVVKRGTGDGGHLATEKTNGATLYLNGALDVDGTGTISHRNGTIVYSGGGSTAYNLNLVGTAKLGADDGLSTLVTMNLGASGTAGDNGTFDLSGYNQTLARILKNTQNATITNTAAAMSTLTLNTTAANDYAGVITGNLSLVKAGNATLTLSGTASHTGTTTVSGGTLDMGANGYNAGSYVVENDATLIFANGTRAHTSTDLLAFGDGGGTVQINAGNFYSNISDAANGVTWVTTTAGTPDNINYATITDNGAGNAGRGVNMNNRNWTFDVAENSVLTYSTQIANGNAERTFTKAGDGDMILNGPPTWNNGSPTFESKVAVTGGTLSILTAGNSMKTAGFTVSNGAKLTLNPGAGGNQIYSSTGNLLTFGEGGGTVDILGSTNFYGNGGGTVTVATTAGTADNVYHSQITSPANTAGFNMHSQALAFQVAEYSELDVAARFWNNNSGITFSGGGTANFAANFGQTADQRIVNLTSDVARLNFQDGVTTTPGSLTVNSGVFSPGGGASDPFGTATIEGGLNLGSGATLLLEIGGVSGWDKLDLQLAGGSFAGDANLIFSVLDSYMATDDPMVIFTGDISSGFGQQLVDKLDEALAGYKFLDYSVDGGMVSLMDNGGGGSAVPEPATWGMLLAGGAMLFFGRRPFSKRHCRLAGKARG